MPGLVAVTAAKQLICAGCGATVSYCRYQLAGFEVYECATCSLRFRSPLPSQGEIISMYEDERYHESAYFRGQTERSSGASPERKIYQRALRDLAELAPRGHLLDVGCGTGLFLKLAAEAGWDVSGVELSKRHADYVRNTLNLEVWQGSFLDAPLSPGSFEAIAMWDFLEHVLDPGAVLARARELLKRDGVLLVFTIDTTSLFNLAGHFLYSATRGLFTRPVELLYDARHNYYFSRRSLLHLLNSNGFVVECWRHDRAYLGRWVSEPAPWYFYAAGLAIDLLSLALRRPYRRTAFCRPFD